MHEYSIVQSLLDSCDEHLKANSATKVTKIVIKIGVLSGVEPELLESAFELFKVDTNCYEAKLVMNIQKILIHCNHCANEQELEKNIFVCPRCQSYDISILDGEDMFLMSLEIE